MNWLLGLAPAIGAGALVAVLLIKFRRPGPSVENDSIWGSEGLDGGDGGGGD